MRAVKWLCTGPASIKLRIVWSKLSPRKLKAYKQLMPFFSGGKGIRIGGRLCDELQECLSYSDTIVDVNILPEYMGQPVRADYLTDAAHLYFAGEGEFDFVCSSHVLEHLANPIKALREWKRVVREGGVVYCGVPDKRFTFDHRRERTPLSHLVDDYRNEVEQGDTTHIQELVDNWDGRLDLCWDTDQQLLEHIRAKPLSGIHHHVWIKDDIVELFEHVGLNVVYKALKGNTIHVVGEKGKCA